MSAINNVDLLSNYIKNLRQNVCKKFNWKTVSKKYDKTFEDLMIN